MTRIYYDTEFLEDGHTIELISIGMVTDDDREYYAVNSSLTDSGTWERVITNHWLTENVVPSLPITGRKNLDRYLAGGTMFTPNPTTNGVRLDHTDSNVKPHQVIANEVRDFIQATDDPQLWAWYGAYDHVALCQLWGRMIDLPDGVPMWTNDLRQERARVGEPTMPRQAEGEHNALDDARHNQVMARFLEQEAPKVRYTPDGVPYLSAGALPPQHA